MHKDKFKNIITEVKQTLSPVIVDELTDSMFADFSSCHFCKISATHTLTFVMTKMILPLWYNIVSNIPIMHNSSYSPINIPEYIIIMIFNGLYDELSPYSLADFGRSFSIGGTMMISMLG